MTKSLTIKKNDKVRVIAGKDKGKEGRVLRAFPESQRVVVEGANFATKAQRPTQRSPQGGLLKKEAAIHVSNVMLICPSCSEPTRVSRRREGGVKLRACKKCGKSIDT